MSLGRRGPPRTPALGAQSAHAATVRRPERRADRLGRRAHDEPVPEPGRLGDRPEPVKNERTRAPKPAHASRPNSALQSASPPHR